MQAQFKQATFGLVLLASTFAGGAALAQQSIEGQTASGAYYKFMVPNDWQSSDGLAIWNHGFDIDAIAPVTDLGPLVDTQLAEGMAVAASSYSLPGWALFNTTQDLREMVQAFEQQVGIPAAVYVSGGSLGGLVTAQAIEAGGLGNVVGAYPICGATAGSRVWDGGLDLRLLYDAVCDGVSGASIPGGASGFPAALLPDPDNADLTDFVTGTIGLAIQACTGILFTPSSRTDDQRQRMERLLSLAQIPEEFLLINMAYSTLVLADTIQRPDKLGGQLALSNIGVDYGDDDINQRIERTQGTALGSVNLGQSYTPTGQIGDTRILALTTDKDGLVVVENLSNYASKVPAEQLVAAVVVEDVPTHCDFSEAEVAAGWRQLRQWIASDSQPSVADVQDECQAIDTAGEFAGPCRIDPNFVLPQLSDRLRVRPPHPFQVGPDISGAWFDSERSGEGWLIEVLDAQSALVYWFTYPVDGSNQGIQSWMLGVGEVSDNQITIGETLITEGAVFGPTFDADDVQRNPWGRMTFSFDDCDSGGMHYSGPLGFNHGVSSLERLTRLGQSSCNDGSQSQQLEAGVAGLSGSWFNESRSGEGWIVQILEDERLVLYWFTYDPQGRQAWITGVGSLDNGSVTISDALITGGTGFGSGFDAAQVELNPWGSITLEFSDCSSGTVSYQSSVAGYGSGTMPMTRLTTLDGFPCSLGGS